MILFFAKLVKTIVSLKIQSLSLSRGKFGLGEEVGDIVMVFKASSKLQLGELVYIGRNNESNR